MFSHFKKIVFLLVCVFPQMSKGEPYYNPKAEDPIFAINESKLVDSDIGVNDKGYLFRKGEPSEDQFDFSRLLSSEAATKQLEYAVYGCKYVVPDCPSLTSKLKKWKKSEVEVHISSEHFANSSDTVSLYEKLFEDIYRVAGITVNFSKKIDDADVVVFIGDEDYLVSQDRNHFNDHVFEEDLLTYFQTLEEQGKGAYGDVFERNPLGCANNILTNKDGFIEKVRIYALSGDSYNCSAKEVFMSMGFEDNIQSVSSVLSHFDYYTKLTKIDEDIIRFVYDSKVSVNMRKSESVSRARNYFKENGYLFPSKFSRLTSYVHSSDGRLNFRPGIGFVTDSDGYIVDGPRRTPSEPIDYSTILTKAYVAEFAKLLDENNGAVPKGRVYLDSCGKLGQKSEFKRFIGRLFDLTNIQGGTFKVSKEIGSSETALLIVGRAPWGECVHNPIYNHFASENKIPTDYDGYLTEYLSGRCAASSADGKLYVISDWRSMLMCSGYFSIEMKSSNKVDNFLSTYFNYYNGYRYLTFLDRCYFDFNGKNIGKMDLYDCVSGYNN
ncbi:hypothetical protein [uncultured Thalassospira sp.]|uniref:hypothetical protein n=1 Tax=uncultured Thalassospira sp. TaxID=404382 RepID=UPI00258DEAFC|nr:hypothetical protein [uncultured Thalassospira sp.]